MTPLIKIRKINGRWHVWCTREHGWCTGWAAICATRDPWWKAVRAGTQHVIRHDHVHPVVATSEPCS